MAGAGLVTMIPGRVCLFNFHIRKCLGSADALRAMSRCSTSRLTLPPTSDLACLRLEAVFFIRVHSRELRPNLSKLRCVRGCTTSHTSCDGCGVVVGHMAHGPLVA